MSGRDLARAREAVGYTVTRQTGIHLRLTTQQGGEHHATTPVHAQLRVGTLAAFRGEVARHFALERGALTERLFD